MCVALPLASKTDRASLLQAELTSSERDRGAQSYLERQDFERRCISIFNLFLWASTLLAIANQGLCRIEYLNTGRAETAICKQIGGTP